MDHLRHLVADEVAGVDLKKPKESVEQNMGGRINFGTVRS